MNYVSRVISRLINFESTDSQAVYGKPADAWSIGVLSLLMITGIGMAMRCNDVNVLASDLKTLIGGCPLSLASRHRWTLHPQLNAPERKVAKRVSLKAEPLYECAAYGQFMVRNPRARCKPAEYGAPLASGSL